jgi:hypothetical protein
MRSKQEGAMGGNGRRALRGLAAMAITGALVASLASVASAATVIGDWKLRGSFKNGAGTAVTLTGVGDVQFATLGVNGTARKALAWDAGEGLRLTKVPKKARASYSISIRFEPDDVSGFKRIMSFGPNDIDQGLYINSGATELYDLADSDATVFAPDTWVRVHLTRDGKTNRVKVYVDGTQVISYRDYREAYRLFLGRSILFLDDSSEHTGGTVAAVKLWRGVKAP